MMINLQLYAKLTTQKKEQQVGPGGFERMAAAFFAVTVEHKPHWQK